MSDQRPNPTEEERVHRSDETSQVLSAAHEMWQPALAATAWALTGKAPTTTSDYDNLTARGKLGGTFEERYQELKKQQTLHPNKAHRDKCLGEPLKRLNEERASQNLDSTATPQYSEVTLREGVNLTHQNRVALETKLKDYNETVAHTNWALQSLSDSEKTLLNFDISTDKSPDEIIEMVKDVNTKWRPNFPMLPKYNKAGFLEHAKRTHENDKVNSWGINKAYYQEKIDAITALEEKLNARRPEKLTENDKKTAVEALILSEQHRQANYLAFLEKAKAERQKHQQELITLLSGEAQAAASLTGHDTLDRTTDKSLSSRIFGTHDKLIEHTHSGEVKTMRYDPQDRTFKATTLRDNQGNPIILSNDEFRKARALFNQTQDDKNTPEMKLAEPVKNGKGLWINCKPEQSAAFNEYIKGHLNQIKGRDLSVSGQVGQNQNARLESTTSFSA
ncbi:MAG: hypothetical protein CL816_02415 [Coxiellaceae bacterium]|nr:hypothetical protein [Coxiellaceae bacterium]